MTSQCIVFVDGDMEITWREHASLVYCTLQKLQDEFMGLNKNVQPQYSIFAKNILPNITHGNQITPQRITLIYQCRSSTSPFKEGIDEIAARIAVDYLNWQVVPVPTSDERLLVSRESIYWHY